MVKRSAVSMTGYAARTGAGLGHDWTWDIRSVNGKGLDLRLRVPDWIEGLEPAARTRIAAVTQRGNVTLSLKLARTEGSATLRVNRDVLAATLAAMRSVELAAEEAGVSLAAASAAEVLSLRGVVDQGSDETDLPALLALLLTDLDLLLHDFARMRMAEGAALAAVIAGQIAQIAALTEAAAGAAAARRPALDRQLNENLARVM
jgi:uncharacterized protein (TIGR00255 family)